MIQLKFEGHDDWYPLEMGVYPNNEPYVKMADPADASTSAVLYVRPYIMQDFVTAMFLADALVELSGGDMQIDLLLPLVPGSRQDRLNIMDDGADRLFTLKSVARMINDRNFRNVVVSDPHSDVTPALIDRCIPLTAADLIAASEKIGKGDFTCIVAPDAGAAKRAAKVAEMWELPVVQAWKTRSPKDGSLTGFGIESAAPLDMYHPLIVDDLCDGGGTFAGLADVIRAQYQVRQLDLYVTHGLFTKGLAPLHNIDHVYTTPSYPHHGIVDNKLTVL